MRSYPVSTYTYIYIFFISHIGPYIYIHIGISPWTIFLWNEIIPWFQSMKTHIIGTESYWGGSFFSGNVGMNHMSVSKNRGYPQNGWWNMVKIMEHPRKMDDLGGKPAIFGNIHILATHFFGVCLCCIRYFEHSCRTIMHISSIVCTFLQMLWVTGPGQSFGTQYCRQPRPRFRGRTPRSQARKLQDSGGKTPQSPGPYICAIQQNQDQPPGAQTAQNCLKDKLFEIGNRYYRYFTPRDTACDALDTGSTSCGPHPVVTRFQASKHLLGCPGREVRINA